MTTQPTESTPARSVPDSQVARPRRMIIVGAVAAGTSAGTQARRNDPSLEIVIYERDRDISYSGCGIPLVLGGQVRHAEHLHPRDPAWFAEHHRIDVRPHHEVVAADRETRSLTVRNILTGELITDHYDVLVLATGATPVVLQVPGVEIPGVFTVRTIRDAEAMDRWLTTHRPAALAVIGSGSMGLELTDQLHRRGLKVTVVERSPQVLPSFDPEMAAHVAETLIRNGVDVRLGVGVAAITGHNAVTAVLLDDGDTIPADMVILNVGLCPNVELARQLGAVLGSSGAIAVDSAMRTCLPDVFAVGDAAESRSLITGQPLWWPHGSTANKMGLVAGNVITGGELRLQGVLGTAIFQVFDLAVGVTGLTERAARDHGYEVVVAHSSHVDRAVYAGGRRLSIKMIADRATGRLLGAQVVGKQGVDKRLDVLATAITFGATAADLFQIDLGYNPPFSTPKDPVHYAGLAVDEARTETT